MMEKFLTYLKITMVTILWCNNGCLGDNGTLNEILSKSLAKAKVLFEKQMVDLQTKDTVWKSLEEELIRDITDKYEMQERLKLLELNQSLMDNLHVSSNILRQSMSFEQIEQEQWQSVILCVKIFTCILILSVLVKRYHGIIRLKIEKVFNTQKDDEYPIIV